MKITPSQAIRCAFFGALLGLAAHFLLRFLG